MKINSIPYDEELELEDVELSEAWEIIVAFILRDLLTATAEITQRE